MFFFLSTNLMFRPKPTVNVSANKCCVCIKAWYILFLCAIVIIKNILGNEMIFGVSLFRD